MVSQSRKNPVKMDSSFLGHLKLFFLDINSSIWDAFVSLEVSSNTMISPHFVFPSVLG